MKDKKTMAIVALVTMLSAAVYEIMRVVDESDIFKAKNAECELNQLQAVEPDIEAFDYSGFSINDDLDNRG